MRKTLPVVLTLMLAACASAPATKEDEFNRLVSHVEKEIGATDKAGFLWRDTEKLVEDARTARKQGREEDAIKLLQKALRQTEMAQQQAKDNATAGPVY